MGCIKLKIGIDEQFQDKQFIVCFIVLFVSFVIYDCYIYSKVTDEYVGSIRAEFVYNHKFTAGTFKNNNRVLIIGCNDVANLKLPICDTGGIYLKESTVDFYNVTYKVVENKCKKKSGDIFCPIHIQKATVIYGKEKRLFDNTEKPINNIWGYILKLFEFLFFPTLFAFGWSVVIILLNKQLKIWISNS